MTSSTPNESEVPVQPVDKPILCSPYVEPDDHWIYDRQTGEPKQAGFRRPAGYWYKTERTGDAQQRLFLEEERDDLPLVNLLRQDVGRWRESGYRGASKITKDLLQHWRDPKRGPQSGSRRLFFCQLEAVETIIYLAELRMPGKSGRTGFQRFELSDVDLARLLAGERPSFAPLDSDFAQRLVDRPFDDTLLPLCRLACKMATGSGKTVVMAMLIAWAFCNWGLNRETREYPNAVLICCPNLTVKERLQVLRPECANNYYDQFDIVPTKYRPLMQVGKVLVTNWHLFAPESEHKEGEQSYAVVNKGPETPETFARRVLGDLADRMPIMVLNDEGHHCWRPAPTEDDLTGEERRQIEEEKQEARVWLDGLDRLNNVWGNGEPSVRFCIDLSATPFYIKGSGYPEGRPFPWIVNDFGLVDAIESGIVKIPRLPVQDTTGRPEPKYFKLWETIREGLQPGERLPGRSGRPKPEVVYREAEGALQQIAGQWVERFKLIQEASPGQEHVPPVLIIVCDNTDIAEVFYQKISGEREEEAVTEADVTEAAEGETEAEDVPKPGRGKSAKPKTTTVYGPGAVYPEHFSNTATECRTLRIDTKLLAQAESDDPAKNRAAAAEDLRRMVATVGKPGEPGEHLRCVVSVASIQPNGFVGWLSV